MLCRTLLLDDEPLVLSALRGELLRPPDIAHDGLEIFGFTSPHEALACLADADGYFDLAIVDYRMPSIDGVTFLTEVKRLRPDAVRILLTGDVDYEAAIKAINDARVDCLVVKPWHEYDLKGRIALALHQRALQRQNQERRGSSPCPPRPPPNPCRMMLVDDDPAVLHALEREIHTSVAGGAAPTYEVTSHTSAEEALQVAALTRPALVIADQAMPGMNGVTFLHHLRAICPDTVRIMFSGRADVATLTDAINIAGVYHFLAKPWAPAELRATIAQALVYRDILIENNAVGETLE